MPDTQKMPDAHRHIHQRLELFCTLPHNHHWILSCLCSLERLPWRAALCRWWWMAGRSAGRCRWWRMGTAVRRARPSPCGSRPWRWGCGTRCCCRRAPGYAAVPSNKGYHRTSDGNFGFQCYLYRGHELFDVCVCVCVFTYTHLSMGQHVTQLHDFHHAFDFFRVCCPLFHYWRGWFNLLLFAWFYAKTNPGSLASMWRFTTLVTNFLEVKQ